MHAFQNEQTRINEPMEGLVEKEKDGEGLAISYEQNVRLSKTWRGEYCQTKGGGECTVQCLH